MQFAIKTLALTIDGRISWCTVPPELRGTGRCNHVAHQDVNESREDFINRLNEESLYDAFEKKTLEGDIDIIPYRMTGEEKSKLVKIEGRKQLEDKDNKGGYIELEDPLWNDADKNEFSKISGISISNINKIIEGELAVVESSDSDKYSKGDILTKAKIKKDELLQDGSVNFEFGVRGLNILASNYGFEATKDIYVVPYYMRQDPPDGDGKHPLNVLYNYIIYNRKDIDKQQMSYESLLKNNESRKPIKQRGGWSIPSLVDELKGKSGVMRAYMSGREIIYSGRAVLGVDVSMEYGYLKIPASMACDIYRPSIVDKLKQEGKNDKEISEFFSKYKGNQIYISKEDRAELDRIIKSLGLRCIANRQPSLHAASILSFRPTISEDSTIKMNPLNFQGFNADLDGDTMSVFAINDVEVSRKANALSAESISGTNMPRHQETSIIKPTKEATWGLLNILNRRTI